MNKKGIITTVIGSVGFLTFLLTLLALIFGQINSQDFSIVAPIIIAFFTFILSIYTKDSNKSHTKDNPPPILQQHDPKKKYYKNDRVLQIGKEWIADVNNGPCEFNPIHWICLT